MKMSKNQLKKQPPRPKDQKRASDRRHYLKHREKILAQYKIYRDANKEKAREYSKRYRAKNKEKLAKDKREYYLEHAEEIKKKVKDWAKANPEKVKQRSLKYRKSHKNEIRKVTKAWRQNNKDKRLVSNQNRRAKKKNSVGRVTAKEWNDLLNFYGHRCLKCQRTDVPLTQDHVIPLSKGGEHIIGNIQPLCVSCNSSKHTNIVDYRK